MIGIITYIFVLERTKEIVILILLSITLTLIGGFIPSEIASKKTLVESLKCE